MHTARGHPLVADQHSYSAAVQCPRVAWTDETKPLVDRPAKFRLLQPDCERARPAERLDNPNYAVSAFAEVIVQLHQERPWCSVDLFQNGRIDGAERERVSERTVSRILDPLA